MLAGGGLSGGAPPAAGTAGAGVGTGTWAGGLGPAGPQPELAGCDGGGCCCPF